jgi:hypothetical protein
MSNRHRALGELSTIFSENRYRVVRIEIVEKLPPSWPGYPAFHVTSKAWMPGFERPKGQA